MTHPLVHGATLLALVAAIAGCTSLGPERTAPTMALSGQYPARPAGPLLPVADGTAQQLDATLPPAAQWWTAYESDALDALVAEGLDGNQDYAAARQRLRAAREALRAEIGDTLLPRVDAGFSPTRQRTLSMPSLPEQTYIDNVFVAQLQVSYTLSAAAVLADRAQAGQVRQQAWQLESSRRALAASIVAACIDAASLQEQIDATTRGVALAERQARQTSERYRLGAASRDDMDASEQDSASAAAALPALRAQLLAVRHALAILLGRTPDRAPAPLPFAGLTLPRTVPLTVPSEWIHQRPDILAAEAAVRASADQAGAATAAMFPSLTLSSSFGRGGFDWSTFTSPAGLIWSASASLSQPLFHGGALVARKHRYEAEYEAAVAQYKQTVLGALRSVADALTALEEDANTLAQTARAHDAALARARTSQARYRLGALPEAATLATERQYQAARVQLIRARAARLADTATLFDALGTPVHGNEPPAR